MTASKRSDFHRLWDGVVEKPEDAARLLILADWLDDRGRDPDLSAGLRWCAKHRKWPGPYPVDRLGPRDDRRRVHWDWEVGHRFLNPPAHLLPTSLWQKLMSGTAVRWDSRAHMWVNYNVAANEATLVRRLGRALKALDMA